MAKTLAGVPDSVTREARDDLVRSLGFDPSVVHSITFSAKAIKVEYLERVNGSVAPHTLTITVKES